MKSAILIPKSWIVGWAGKVQQAEQPKNLGAPWAFGSKSSQQQGPFIKRQICGAQYIEHGPT
eukprot:1158042-Pelagomonas_calceolata.AAC.1